MDKKHGSGDNHPHDGKNNEMERDFWKKKTLGDLTREEWEALCDGCGRCCVEKSIDLETGEIFYTAEACRLLDLETCRCTEYARRQELEPECVMLTPENIAEAAHWLPPTCAYRLLFEGRDLPSWHPLVTGDPNSTRDAGFSVRDHAHHVSD